MQCGMIGQTEERSNEFGTCKDIGNKARFVPTPLRGLSACAASAVLALQLKRKEL